MKNIILSFIFCLSIGVACAQKQPSVQEGNQLLPAEVNVDGKLNEWPEKLNAYNKSTRLEYVMANNDDDLYLAIRSEDVGTTAKILAGGLTLNINTSGKKKDDGPSITFPLTDAGYEVTETGRVRSNFKVLTDSADIVEEIKGFKFISVNNLNGVQDSVLSIYNVQGLKAQMNYDNEVLVCEIMIPKKLLGLADFSTPFAYHVRLDGVERPFTGGGRRSFTPNFSRSPDSRSNLTAEINVPTDFWGEYGIVE
ncbi:hypothetical protein GCM10027049_30310 [Mucilaginibacter puniceus]